MALTRTGFLILLHSKQKKCSRTSSFGGIHGIAVIIKAHIAGLNDEQSKRTCNLEAQFNLGDDANSFINGKLTIE